MAAIFSPRDLNGRQQPDALAIARVGQLSYTAAGEGMISLRRAEGAAAAAAPAHKVAPLALKPEAVRELLLAQPRREMGAAELRARFAPSTAAERKQLAVAIAEVAEMLPASAERGPAVVRLRRERPPLTERGANAAAAAASAATSTRRRRWSSASCSPS